MSERDYRSSPVSDALGIRAVIDGLASDLQDLRAGTSILPKLWREPTLHGSSSTARGWCCWR